MRCHCALVAAGLPGIECLIEDARQFVNVCLCDFVN